MRYTYIYIYYRKKTAAAIARLPNPRERPCGEPKCLYTYQSCWFLGETNDALRAMILSWGFIRVACAGDTENPWGCCWSQRSQAREQSKNVGQFANYTRPRCYFNLSNIKSMAKNWMRISKQITGSKLQPGKSVHPEKHVWHIGELNPYAGSHEFGPRLLGPNPSAEVLRFHGTLVHCIVVVHVHHNHLSQHTEEKCTKATYTNSELWTTLLEPLTFSSHIACAVPSGAVSLILMYLSDLAKKRSLKIKLSLSGLPSKKTAQ